MSNNRWYTEWGCLRWEFDKLAAHLPTHLRPLMEFLFLTGWRKQEALTLAWARVDFNAAILRLDPGTTKTDEGRAFPFDAYPQLAHLLGAQWEDSKAAEAEIGQQIPWVFWRRHGGHVLPIKDYYTGWRSACRKAGISRVPHDFRRTAVRNMERAGLSRSTAMSLTGHKTEAVYRRYAIVAERDQREAVAKLSQLVAGDREKVIPIDQVQPRRAAEG